MKFSELGLIDPILRALEAQGYESPTPIQRGAIPPALAGRDVLGCAQTGTGKTCAFSAPILQRLNSHPVTPRVIRSLVLTPTRELALQIQECFESYGRNLPLRSAVIFGGVGQNPQVEKLRRGVDILVATPGRLLDLHGQGLLDLSHVEIFVLDEADRMLDMGFIHDVRRVLKVLPQQKQTLFFSATMPPEVMELVNALLHDYARVEVDPVSSPVEVIRQSLYYVDKANKTKLLAHLIEQEQMDSVLVFSRTKYGANRIAGDLAKRGIPAAAIHGNKSQTARQQALADFKSGRIRALVATDIAARGIDIDELKWVVNYDLPEVPETYVHRIGRTGRAGHDGSALSFCRADERDYLRQIERLLGKRLPVVDDHPFPMTEAATGVDPMTQARREAKENARARRNAQTQSRVDSAASKPAPKSAPTSKSVFKPAPAPASAKEQTVPPTPAPAPQSSKGKSERPQRKPKRGVRQGDLSATTPAAPAMPTADFVKPDPLASDVVMDATARLLAPRRAAHSKPVSTAAPSKARPADRNGAKPRSGSKKPAERTEAKPSASETQQRTAHTAPSAPSKPKNSPSKGQKKRGYDRRGGPRPIERSLHSVHHKDSTEQKDSVMKPYYLSDDR